MTSTPNSSGPRLLRPGQELAGTDLTRLWCVRRGMLGIAHDALAEDARTQFLALSGDLIGAELLAGEGAPGRVVAVTAAELEPVPCFGLDSRHGVLSMAYAQSRRQGREILRLRTGLVADRVKQMLLLLGEHGEHGEVTDVELPSLRQLADLLDASPEAICRVLGRMKQLDVLVARRPRSARVSTRALSALVPPPGMSSSLPGVRAELAHGLIEAAPRISLSS